jgi:hypothetical protein
VTGSQHFREAERLLTEAGEVTRPDNGLSDDESTTIVRVVLAKAQVHATLALAAATNSGFGTAG